VSAIAVSPDGLRLASTHGDGSLRIVRLDRDQTELERTFAGGVLKDVAFSPDGGSLVVQPTSGPPSIVELTPPWSTHTLPNGQPARRVAWSAAGILTSTYGGGLTAWSTAVDTAPRRLAANNDFRDVLPWRETGRTLAFTGDLHAFDLDLSQQGDSALRPAPAYDGFVSVAASARFVGTKGTHITTIDHDGARATFALDGYQPITVAISPDGRWIATGTVEGSVFVFDADDARRVAVLRGHTRQTVSLAFSPDGSALFSGSWDHTVRRWSIWPLTTSPESARAAVVQSWGRSADDIIAQASDTR
jgi:WD40 repeat protein